MPRTLRVLNLSGRISDEDARAAVVACDRQLENEFSSAWGMVPPIAYFSSSKSTPLAEEFMAFVDVVGTGMFGFHSETPDGKAYGLICVPEILSQPGSSVLSGPLSCSAVLSHEILEWALDPMINAWREGPDGYDYALEACDAVQSSSYETDAVGKKVTVSNFLLPAWFDRTPQEGDRFDFLGVLSKPFTIDALAYAIRRKVGEARSDVWGQRAAWKGDAVPVSRGVKRGVVEESFEVVTEFENEYPYGHDVPTHALSELASPVLDDVPSSSDFSKP